MARSVIDAPTLLCLVAGDVPVDGQHGIVAPHLIRSQAQLPDARLVLDDQS